MFEVGFTELLLIFALALLVLGPQKLPKLAQQVGRWVGRARAMARQFRDQLEEEAHNLETQVSIDPEIDTSLEPKPKTTTPPTHSAAASTSPASPPYHDAPYRADPGVEAEEEFYPPDHHMHPSQRAAASATPVPADGADVAPASTQGELDLSSTPEAPPPKAP